MTSNTFQHITTQLGPSKVQRFCAFRALLNAATAGRLHPCVGAVDDCTNTQQHNSPAVAVPPVRLPLQPLLLLPLLPPAPPLPPSPLPLLLQLVPHAAPPQQPGVPASLTRSGKPAGVVVGRVSPPAGADTQTYHHASATAALHTCFGWATRGLLRDCIASWRSTQGSCVAD
jgi:hypothetical protein